MKFFKFTVVLVAVLALSVPAWSGSVPEFDAVGQDADNPFAFSNVIQYGQVIANNIGYYGVPINEASDFRGYEYGYPYLQESFETSAGELYPDPCFGEFGVYSAMTDTANEATYDWVIVLQMKPESDINLNIYDCVRNHNKFLRWTEFAQTGRYRLDWGKVVFNAAYNPVVSVTAHPGPYATPGFETPFTMDARTLPGLAIVPMDNIPYSSKALWDEGFLLVRPETGETTGDGNGTQYNLKQGDRIKVSVYVNEGPGDVFYGPDNAILRYIGIWGSFYTTADYPNDS